MSWVKVDDTMPQNPKVRMVSVPARWAYVASICYAGLNRTDGVIPRASLALVDATPKLAAELVSAGLWEPHAHGWAIHDYLAHNRSRERIDSISVSRSESGRKGLAKRYANGSQLASEPASKTLANDLANREQLASGLPLSGSGSVSDLPQLQEPDQENNHDQNRQNASKLLAPDERDALYRRLCDGWMHATGTTMARQAVERFEAYCERTSEEWVFDAIRETGNQGKRVPSYTFAILENWIANGREQQEETHGNGTGDRGRPVSRGPARGSGRNAATGGSDQDNPIRRRLALEAEHAASE